MVGLVLALVGVPIVTLGLYDLIQRRHSILRNFPVIGHFRFLIEKIGPELRQYIVADNDEERPFSRDQRRWVYATAKKENSYFGFGTDDDLDKPGRIIFRNAPFPLNRKSSDEASVPCGKILGGWRNRRQSFRPASVINISAMSFGSLSGAAISALNRGSKLSNCLHNTGEGGISEHHMHGGDLVYQLGTGYFGSRDLDGNFSIDALMKTIASAPVRAIEIKLSQGAKPGIGGLLPAAKVTKEIAKARGVPVNRDVASPSAHTVFSDVEGLVEFVELIAEKTGLPVGIKSAVGSEKFWNDLASYMAETERGPDFVTVDGSEGGTGAAPLVFSDHVSLPFWHAFPLVINAFAKVGLSDHIVFIGSGKLGLPAEAAEALALGVDIVNVGREAMLAIGCVQAQKCHTGHCPTGVATQSRWLERGLDPKDKGVRLANYVTGLRYEMLRLSHACGVEHPALLSEEKLAVTGDGRALMSAHSWYGVAPEITQSKQRVAGIASALKEL